MAASFVPPSRDGKPEVPAWIPPKPTKLISEWADLREIDLSKLDSPDPSVVDELVQTTKKAIREDGFIYLINYGISLEALHRQFALAKYLHSNITENEKTSLKMDPRSGHFAGWKGRRGWTEDAGMFDGIEHFNFYREEYERPERVPECIRPFMDEIEAFSSYLTTSVNYRLMKLLSRVLELPDDFLWENIQSQGGPTGMGYLRHMMYIPLEPGSEAKTRMDGERLGGHTDYGTTTMLFSVPVTALQTSPNRDGKWKYVKYNPGALVINIGDALEIVSGGQFKATLHKVTEPPADQQGVERLLLVLFNTPQNIILKPIMESKLLQRDGFNLDTKGVFTDFKRLIDSGAPLPTSKEFRELQIATRNLRPPQERYGASKDVDGVRHREATYQGVKVLLPV